MAKKDYEAGYGKPPKKHQFRQGQSGNPKGRPKGAANLAMDVLTEAGKRIEVSEGGKKHRITKRAALIKMALAKGIQGDPRFAQMGIQQIASAEDRREANRAEAALSAVDDEILERYIEWLKSEAKGR